MSRAETELGFVNGARPKAAASSRDRDFASRLFRDLSAFLKTFAATAFLDLIMLFSHIGYV
jgi:hypothetical protein